MDNEITFIYAEGDYFWHLEGVSHVHDMITGRCLKNVTGSRCGKRKTFTVRMIDRTLDFLAKRL